MRLVDIPPEIILAIFRNCTSVADVLRFSQACRRIHGILSASQRILILYHAAEYEFGPLRDVVQLLTFNNSQPAHYIRDPPRSDSLLRQIVVAGRVAKRWEDIYPFCKWDADFADRRSLSANERYCLRRAIYRHWLYAHAFHTPKYSRTSRRVPHLVLQRGKLLHNWPTRELIEIDDFHATVRALISTKICPSDSALHAAYASDDGQFQPYLAKRSLAVATQHFFHTSRDGHAINDHFSPSINGPDGWGDPVTHYYIVEDVLKLDPKAVLWLYDHPQKRQVEGYLDSLGDWFRNNGATFSETLACVLERRESDLAEEIRHPYSGVIDTV